MGQEAGLGARFTSYTGGTNCGPWETGVSVVSEPDPLLRDEVPTSVRAGYDSSPGVSDPSPSAGNLRVGVRLKDLSVGSKEFRPKNTRVGGTTDGL